MPLGVPALCVSRAGRYVATSILTDARAPAHSLSCVPQATLFVQQQARRPARGHLQHHEISVRREGRERHITHTHTNTGASSLCMPLGLHARASCVTRRPLWCSLTRVPPRPLSRVFRRRLNLQTADRFNLLPNNPALTCVPLSQARIATIREYYGPMVTCQVNCCASCV